MHRSALGLSLLLHGCGSPEPDCDCSTFGVEQGCVIQGEASARGAAPEELVEASGLALSRLQAGRLWAHNDAGGAPELYALDAQARLTGVFSVEGAEPVDWEDLASGEDPHSGLATLYVADIGDNEAQREELLLYRLGEPAGEMDGGLVVYESVRSEAIRLRYPDGPQDAETLLRDPWEDALWILPREPDGQGELRLYGLPATATGEQLLERGPTVAVGGAEITGGDIRPDGELVALHTADGRALLWQRSPGQPLAEALSRAPCELALPTAPGRGEALAVDAAALWMIAEGEGAELWELALP